MKRLPKLWPVWLLALCVFAMGYWIWWDSGRLKPRVIGRAACEMQPVVTETGVLCFPKWNDSACGVPSPIEFYGWDGQLRWRISNPQDDYDAFSHWHPHWQSYKIGGDWSHSPDGRIFAQYVFEPAGARVMIWRDGQLCGDHHLEVRPGALFDGKSGVDLNVLDDGRVIAVRNWPSTGCEIIFQNNRILYSGKKKTVLPLEARYLEHENAGKLQVIDKYSGKGWTLPTEAVPGKDAHTVISRNGRFVLYYSAPRGHHASVRKMLDFMAKIPGLNRVDDQKTWRDALLIEQPGIVRARGKLDDRFYHGFLSPDGNTLALRGDDDVTFMKLR